MLWKRETEHQTSLVKILRVCVRPLLYGNLKLNVKTRLWKPETIIFSILILGKPCAQGELKYQVSLVKNMRLNEANEHLNLNVKKI